MPPKIEQSPFGVYLDCQTTTHHITIKVELKGSVQDDSDAKAASIWHGNTSGL
jgi:hypothetical protein